MTKHEKYLKLLKFLYHCYQADALDMMPKRGYAEALLKEIGELE